MIRFFIIMIITIQSIVVGFFAYKYNQHNNEWQTISKIETAIYKSYINHKFRDYEVINLIYKTNKNKNILTKDIDSIESKSKLIINDLLSIKHQDQYKDIIDPLTILLANLGKHFALLRGALSNHITLSDNYIDDIFMSSIMIDKKYDKLLSYVNNLRNSYDFSDNDNLLLYISIFCSILSMIILLIEKRFPLFHAGSKNLDIIKIKENIGLELNALNKVIVNYEKIGDNPEFSQDIIVKLQTVAYGIDTMFNNVQNILLEIENLEVGNLEVENQMNDDKKMVIKNMVEEYKIVYIEVADSFSEVMKTIEIFDRHNNAHADIFKYIEKIIEHFNYLAKKISIVR